ncbi:MAG: Mrp/NBP35 family ATP-binding protein [Gemmatimonadota bacterium]
MEKDRPEDGAAGSRGGKRRSLPIVGAPPRPSAALPHARPGPPPVSRQEASRRPSEAEPLDGVRHVVAVSSGKGGVGKSTVAANVAAAWGRSGHRVGLLDADVYGPDIPTMLGVYGRPGMANDEIIPLEAHGIKLMSLGFLVDEETPAIWRGPIVMGIMRQFLRQVRWGELDYLVVDLPPGTGDAQLSLVQLVRVTGAIMVTSPQDVAVGGVLRGIKMFETVEIPIVGVVENMRGFVCPDCGSVHDIFGSGGGEALAASVGVPFLGAVPLGTAVREEGDRGMPTVIGRPESSEGTALRRIAQAAAERIVELGAAAASR